MHYDIDSKTYMLIEFQNNPSFAISMLAEYVGMFLAYKKKKSLDEAAVSLKVSRGTLIKVRRKNPNLRTSTISTIIDALIDSKCPEPLCLKNIPCEPVSYCKSCPLANSIISLSGLAEKMVSQSS
ncbi:MAG: hypothetical protein IKP88_17335 [Lachnospiraceae bacterium]|nr:hypothetical protein [Lachnospiraceae bacterium]